LNQQSTRRVAALASLLAIARIASSPADARRGGTFGSRGSRTYSAPRPTSGSARYAPPGGPVDDPSSQSSPAYGQQQSYRSGGSHFGGFGGGLLGGLVAGGLIGHFFGGGMGGPGRRRGLPTSLLQIAIFGGIARWAIGYFRRRSSARPDGMGRTIDNTDGFVPFAGSSPRDDLSQPVRSDPIRPSISGLRKMIRMLSSDF
jgi:predicted lipid-binding transport protein (Tim44 family)